MSALPDLVAIVPVATTVAASSLVVKATPGQLMAMVAATGAVAGYVMLFDAAAAPADGAVSPVWVSGLIAANTSVTVFAVNGGPGIRFNTGIVAVFSSTGPFTKTASATAYISGLVA